jgi:energy-coupling factor transporter ATP-binding protein EcfA2
VLLERERELATLAARRRGALVLVMGEAGAGKTSLLRTFAAVAVARAEARWLEGSAPPDEALEVAVPALAVWAWRRRTAGIEGAGSDGAGGTRGALSANSALKAPHVDGRSAEAPHVPPATPGPAPSMPAVRPGDPRRALARRPARGRHRPRGAHARGRPRGRGASLGRARLPVRGRARPRRHRRGGAAAPRPRRAARPRRHRHGRRPRAPAAPAAHAGSPAGREPARRATPPG